MLGAACAGAQRDLAEKLLDRFGSLPAVLAADPAALRAVGGEHAAAGLVLVRQCLLRCLEREAFSGQVFAGSRAVLDYLHAAMAHRPSEELWGLFLDTGNRLLKRELLSTGTVDHAPMYRREVVRRALDLNAAALILVHNHPSGNPEPSELDLHATRAMARTLADVGVRLKDHLVIARAGWRSIGIDHA